MNAALPHLQYHQVRQRRHTGTAVNPLQPLQDLVDLDLQPDRQEFWLFLDTTPYRTNGLQIDSNHLPTDHDCKALAGLDIVLVINGFMTNCGVFKNLCGSILAARPRLLMVYDRDYKKVAHLKLWSCA